ncbi:MAG: lytic murein transglycosylase [Vicinamibacterales bacterium]
MRAAALLVSFAVVLCAAVAAQSLPPVLPVATRPPFAQWLLELRSEAERRGVSTELLDRALAGIEPLEQVLERDRTQAEFTLDLEQYLKRRLTRNTVRTAQRMFSKHRALLARIEKQYGVPARVLVSVWGLESNFGRFAGVRPTIPALVTLAYDPRRGAMFREELFSALEIVNRGDIELENLKGSWAGALGQPQFMPSSYLQFAQDFDGDGRKDIWTSTADVFASVANFLQQHGWQSGSRWGREVRIPAALTDAALALPRRQTGCRAIRLMTDPMTLTEWRAFGVRTTIPTALVPKSDITASLVMAGGRSFLVYENYDALLGYNCAHSYTLSVALLSDLLK